MSDPKRILIVGGVAGGASAAARARRLDEHAEIVMFERGEHISFANCGLPYHIAGTIEDRAKLLVQTPQSMNRRFRIDVRTKTEVTAIAPSAKEIVAMDLDAGREYREKYDALILSPGAEPVKPPIPGAYASLVHTLRNISDMDAVIETLDSSTQTHAVIVGGGYIGLEMAEALRLRSFDVTLVELAEQVMGPADPEMTSPIVRELESKGVRVLLETSVIEFRETSGGLTAALSSGDTVECGVAILAIGVRPETALAAEAGLAIGKLGGITVDQHMRTSDPDIYAVGDVVEVEDFVGGYAALVPLAGPANRQGRIAADNIFGRNSEYKKTQGTAICKVFDLAIGMTGMSEKALKREGMEYEKVYLHTGSHAGYYPGAEPLSFKLLFSPADGRILGAQAAGKDGVDKRIDVIAVAIRAGMTVYDLTELELSYAPPYGSAKDVVNYAGFVAANVLRGDAALCHSEDVHSPGAGQILLDVRTEGEVAKGRIGDAMHVPLDELRERMSEIPREKELLVYCQSGLRGYIACRILTQNGFSCRNLTGGLKTYLDAEPFVGR